MLGVGTKLWMLKVGTCAYFFRIPTAYTVANRTAAATASRATGASASSHPPRASFATTAARTATATADSARRPPARGVTLAYNELQHLRERIATLEGRSYDIERQSHKRGITVKGKDFPAFEEGKSDMETGLEGNAWLLLTVSPFCSYLFVISRF